MGQVYAVYWWEIETSQSSEFLEEDCCAQDVVIDVLELEERKGSFGEGQKPRSRD